MKGVKGSSLVCAIEGCETPSKTRGWCNKHYKRWLTHGDPLVVKSRLRAEKNCTVCGELKPRTDFYKGDKERWIRSACKTCFPDVQFNGYLTRTYGINADDYGAMMERQGGVCAICSGVNKDRRLVVDHCHETGDVRGLLCIRCNRALGMFEDDPALLELAALYVKLGGWT